MHWHLCRHYVILLADGGWNKNGSGDFGLSHMTTISRCSIISSLSSGSGDSDSVSDSDEGKIHVRRRPITANSGGGGVGGEKGRLRQHELAAQHANKQQSGACHLFTRPAVLADGAATGSCSNRHDVSSSKIPRLRHCFAPSSALGSREGIRDSLSNFSIGFAKANGEYYC